MTPLDLNATSPDFTPHTLDNYMERKQQDTLDAEAQFLMRQTRLWRVLNSAQWVAWGIVQAEIPGMNADSPEPPSPHVDSDIEESDEFDYLAYAQDRATFFWADLVSLGFVQREQLPKRLVQAVEGRMIDY